MLQFEYLLIFIVVVRKQIFRKTFFINNYIITIKILNNNRSLKIILKKYFSI